MLFCISFVFFSYRRGDRVAHDSSETYDTVLENALGFSNPSNVDVLLAKLGVSESKCFSMMRGLQRYSVFCAVGGGHASTKKRK